MSRLIQNISVPVYVLIVVLSLSCVDSFRTISSGQESFEEEDLSDSNYNQEDFHERIEEPNDEGDPPDRYPSSQTEGEGRVTREGMCANMKEIHRSIKALDCSKPVMKTVRLRSPGPNYAIVPSVAQVQRCAGHCNHPRSCLPSKTTTIRIPVYKFDKTNVTQSQTCVEYELLQHEECRCKCALEMRHCTERQVYDANNCACGCKNQDEKHKCLAMQFSSHHSVESYMTQWYWDEPACDCKCVPKPCGRLRVWVPSMCRCMQIPIEEDDEDNALF